MAKIDKETLIEIYIFSLTLIVSYLLSAFIFLDWIWFMNVSAIIRLIYLAVWIGSAFGITYKVES